jgi:hypothetical protein
MSHNVAKNVVLNAKMFNCYGKRWCIIGLGYLMEMFYNLNQQYKNIIHV